LAVCGN